MFYKAILIQSIEFEIKLNLTDPALVYIESINDALIMDSSDNITFKGSSLLDIDLINVGDKDFVVHPLSSLLPTLDINNMYTLSVDNSVFVEHNRIEKSTILSYTDPTIRSRTIPIYGKYTDVDKVPCVHPRELSRLNIVDYNIAPFTIQTPNAEPFGHNNLTLISYLIHQYFPTPINYPFNTLTINPEWTHRELTCDTDIHFIVHLVYNNETIPYKGHILRSNNTTLTLTKGK